jgi:hypothetical protein
VVVVLGAGRHWFVRFLPLRLGWESLGRAHARLREGGAWTGEACWVCCSMDGRCFLRGGVWILVAWEDGGGLLVRLLIWRWIQLRCVRMLFVVVLVVGGLLCKMAVRGS